MVRYIDEHRERFGVEPICAVLPIAPSTYYEQKVREAKPDRRPARAIRDEELKPQVQRVFDENFRVYGADKVWKQLNREAVRVARCTVERLMAALGLQGATRGGKAKTTIPAELAERPADHVKRQFSVSKPNALWVSDLT
jgi:transposase InsO family protein